MERCWAWPNNHRRYRCLTNTATFDCQEFKDIEDIIFAPTRDFVWEAANIILEIRGDDIKVFRGKKRLVKLQFDDLLEAIAYIQKICGKRPVFTMDDKTANIRTGIGTAYDVLDGDRPQQC